MHFKIITSPCIFSARLHISPVKMSYELYRTSTLGYTLQDTLDDLIASQQITPGAERERTPLRTP